MTSLFLVALFALDLNPAQAATSAAERAEARVEASQSWADLAQDRDQLARLSQLIADWDRARASGSRAAERRADDALASWLDSELRERRRDLAQARAEVGRSATELQQEKRDDGRVSARKASSERAQLADDARDLADDRADLARVQSDVQQLESIDRQLRTLRSRFERRQELPADAAWKARLYAQLRSLATRELQRDAAERSEDARERAEDRRDR